MKLEITIEGQSGLSFFMLAHGRTSFGWCPSHRAIGWFLIDPSIESLFDDGVKWIDDPEDFNVRQARWAYERLLASWQARMQCVLGPDWPIMLGRGDTLCDFSINTYRGGSITGCMTYRRWAPGGMQHGSPMYARPDYTWFGGKLIGFDKLPDDEWCEKMAEQMKIALEAHKADHIKEYGER